MTTENTAAALETEAVKVEQSVKVYLEHDSVNRRWIVDPLTMDGGPLDGLDSPDVDIRPEYRTPETLAEMEAAAELHLPNGEQLVLLLVEALPEESTIKDAVAEVLEAAASWADELTSYVAAASEANGEHQTAANQRETAEAIRRAVTLLNV
ncbi:hypothetical protein [Paenarthrobacter sp. NPDC090522]|uniref:hypothetical protein n=1 Tax=Paenarthrobacter sp. NPDC090522 TaxID=3364383 RepID=UPI0038262C79